MMHDTKIYDVQVGYDGNFFMNHVFTTTNYNDMLEFFKLNQGIVQYENYREKDWYWYVHVLELDEHPKKFTYKLPYTLSFHKNGEEIILGW
jgi:hypothetical protein